MAVSGKLEFSDKMQNGTAAPIEIPKEKRFIRTQAYDKSILDLVSMVERQDIILDPEYQRNYLWNNRQASLLVESILLSVPIPVVYVAEDEDKKWNIIDGLQRIHSLQRFYKENFKLRGLEVLQELDGLRYGELNDAAQEEF